MLEKDVFGLIGRIVANLLTVGVLIIIAYEWFAYAHFEFEDWVYPFMFSLFMLVEFLVIYKTRQFLKNKFFWRRTSLK